MSHEYDFNIVDNGSYVVVDIHGNVMAVFPLSNSKDKYIATDARNAAEAYVKKYVPNGKVHGSSNYAWTKKDHVHVLKCSECGESVKSL